MPPRMWTVLTALVYLYLGLSNTCSGQQLRSHTPEAPTNRRLACESTTALLKSGEYVYTDQNPLTTKSTGKDAATYIKQLANGPVAVYTWDAVRKDRKICQTPYPGGASGKYWTKLQGDGNFVTYSGIYPSTSTRVWKSNVIGASGTYKLDVKCDDKVAIYKEGSNTPLWTCPPAPAPPGCQTATLLKSGEYIFTNQSPWTTKPTGPNGSTTYIQQQDNGRVNVYTFDTERKDRKICQTPYSGTSGNYWTKLQGDGNFITYRGLYPSTATMVWKSNAVGASGTYKLDVKCNDTVAIYREGSTTPLWTCPK